MLAQSKHHGWRALQGLSREAARAQLATELVEADPGFAAANPQLIGQRSASHSMTMMVMQLLARRLPRDLDNRINRVQCMLLWIFAEAAVCSLFASLRRRTKHAYGKVLWPCVGAATSALTLYFTAVVHGLPSKPQAALMLWLRNRGYTPELFRAGAIEQHSNQPDPVNIGQRFLLRVLAPRAVPSLFDEQ